MSGEVYWPISARPVQKAVNQASVAASSWAAGTSEEGSALEEADFEDDPAVELELDVAGLEAGSAELEAGAAELTASVVDDAVSLPELQPAQ